MKNPNSKTSFRNQARRAVIGKRVIRDKDDGLSPNAAHYIDVKYKQWLARRGYSEMGLGKFV